MKDQQSDMKFELALKRLEEVVEQLESGEVPLEQSIQLFQEGTNLAGFCRERLAWAEQQIEVLVKENNGWAKKPFETEEDER
ncbi:exodeoxyribonuclease VII small subunit [Risungbinella massiliensis]|uniref:exodeoxyribonuclease VII small subunit n=1 Tax=Risungbinella massiliensis TaxID=1329796 RepID=UPI0005CC3F3B|nr:exodeoxyribonuclease VII small subunit [Risungbinella massiliensis]